MFVDADLMEDSLKSLQTSEIEREAEELKKLQGEASDIEPQPPKRQHSPKKEGWTYDAGVFVVPHPKKTDHGGEDAYFVGHGVFGVADGVSSWAKYGIDPGRFSKKLMKVANEIAEETKDPLEILETAFEKTKSSVPGSSTACIVSFNGSQMDTVNLGDSGFIVYRDGGFPICARAQQHSFNCPYQLGSRSSDVPADGQRETFEVKDGDIVILFTDGLSANLYAEKIAEVVKAASIQNDPQVVAEHLAKEAFFVSQNPTADIPFSQDAQEIGLKREGGKEDDITVLVIFVKDNSKSLGPSSILVDETTPLLGR